MVEQSLVYIYAVKPAQRFAGCGVLVEGGFVATCRHVWRDAAAADQTGRPVVEIEFPRSRDEKGETIAVPAYLTDACDEGSGLPPDLVLLKPDTIPVGASSVTVASHERFEVGQGYALTGLLGRDATQPNRPRDVRVDGVISSHLDGNDLRQFTGSNQAAYWASRGSSGSPIFVNGGMQLAGLLSLSELGVNEGAGQIREAFIVPGTIIRRHLERVFSAPTAAVQKVDPDDLRPILEAIGAADVPVAEIPNRLREFVEAARTRAAEPVAHTNVGDEIEATIAASRERLRTLDAAGAYALLEDKIADEREARDQRLASLLRERAAVERLTYQFDKAKVTLTEIAVISRDDVWAWIELGDLWNITGNLTEAVKAYDAGEAVARRVGNQRNLSVSLDRIGDSLRAQGKLEEAIGRYRNSLVIRERLAARDPTNTEWQRDLSVCLDRIGDVLTAQGKLDEAIGRYRDGLAIIERLAASNPTNTGWQRDLSVSFERIGDVLTAQGKLDEAIGRYRDGLAIIERLAAADPTHAGWQRDLSVSFNRIGDVLRAQGKLDEAIGRYSDGLAIAERLADDDPTNTEWQRDLVVSFIKIGDMLRARGKLDEAIGRYRDGLAIAERLAAADPTNAEWQRDLSVSFARIGDVLRDQGKLDEAIGRYRDGLAIAERLAAADPTNAEWQRDLSVSLNKIGDVLRDRGKLDEAIGRHRDSLDIRERLAARDPTNTEWQRDLAVSLDRIGDVLRTQGKLNEAIGRHRDSLDIR